MYLFAVLFALTSLFIFTLALLNTYLHFLPEYYQFNFSTTGVAGKTDSLQQRGANRRGFYQYRLVNIPALQPHRGKCRTRQLGLPRRGLAHTSPHPNQQLSPASDSLRRKMPETVATLAASLSTDVNLFSPDGILLFSTQEDLARLGVLPGKMSPEALAMLSREGQTKTVVSEQVAGVGFFRQIPFAAQQPESVAWFSGRTLLPV